MLGIAARILGDDDFCSTGHRLRFHERARKGLQQIETSPDAVQPVPFMDMDLMRSGDITSDVLCGEWFAPAATIRVPALSLSIDATDFPAQLATPQLGPIDNVEEPAAQDLQVAPIFELPVAVVREPAPFPDASTTDALTELRKRLEKLRCDVQQKRFGNRLHHYASA